MALVVVLLQVEGALGTEGFVAEEAEDVAVQIVRARLGHDRQRAAGGAADLRVEPVLDDPELADGVLAEAGAGEAEGRVGEVDAVDEDGRLRGVTAGADDRTARHETESAALALDDGGEESQA